MDNKLSELSRPVGFVSKLAQTFLKCGETASIRPFFDVQGSSPLYSQEYVSALTQRIAELEKHLATPVRLLGEMLLHDWEHSTERQATFQHRKIAWDARLAEDKKAILAAGFTFTVEGDDQ